MKVIIAGGREFVPYKEHTQWLVENLLAIDPELVITGGAKGADAFGHSVATNLHIPAVEVIANWNKHGKAAGPIRNKAMALLGDLLIVFPGGTGTQNMIDTMKKQKKPILSYERQVDLSWFLETLELDFSKDS